MSEFRNPTFANPTFAQSLQNPTQIQTPRIISRSSNLGSLVEVFLQRQCFVVKWESPQAGRLLARHPVACSAARRPSFSARGSRTPRRPSAWGLKTTIAEKTGLKSKDVKGVFGELQTIAYSEVAKSEKFVIPQLVALKLKHKPARKAGGILVLRLADF